MENSTAKYFDPLFIYIGLGFVVLICVTSIRLIVKTPVGVRLDALKKLHRTILGEIGLDLLVICACYQNAAVRSVDIHGFIPIGEIIGSVAWIYGFFWPPRTDIT